MSEWQPIETFDQVGQACPAIIAVTDAGRPGIVGEAWLHEDGEWWWAGTAPQDYCDQPISQISHGQVTHWQPLPPHPGKSA